MDADDVVARLLTQNDRLIGGLVEAVRASSPEAILRALNPPYAGAVSTSPPTPAEPYAADEGPQSLILDPWADDNLPNEAVIPGFAGWTDPPVPQELRVPPATDLSYVPDIQPPTIQEADPDGPTAAP